MFKYPITVDIIKQICLKFGKLLKIFIGKKNQDNVVECLVEFEKISEAKAAKEALHGEDIYSGCCSLDVKYSKMSNVPVFKNDDESWDFSKSQVKQGILKVPPSNGSVSSNNVNVFTPTNPQLYSPVYNFPPPMSYNHMPVPPIHGFPCHNLIYNYPSIQKNSKSKSKLDINKDAFVVEIGVVFMVYNLPFNICVDHLFNLFCLYGNVNKIKFTNQPGTAMVQMGSKAAVETCIQYYNNKTLFGQEMHLMKCNKPEIFPSKNIEFLPNGTPVFKDFSADANNRFLNDHGINSNKILEPNRTLHFFNAPYTFAEIDLNNMIIQSGVPRPINIIIFSNKNDHVKKCIGLFEFHRLEDSLIALSVLNHKPIIIPDTNQVFHMKLTFSAREPKNVNPGHVDIKRCQSFRETPEIDQISSKKSKFEIKDELDNMKKEKEVVTVVTQPDNLDRSSLSPGENGWCGLNNNLDNDFHGSILNEKIDCKRESFANNQQQSINIEPDENKINNQSNCSLTDGGYIVVDSISETSKQSIIDNCTTNTGT
uniref:HnRNP L protein n=1 Tax=Dugesia japonica TaxID=6161 RepID=A4V6K3_DUGJA|nr:hnRNP L protein [Dugesia japonica]